MSPNESEHYFSDLIENFPREVGFGRWIEFEGFADAKPHGSLSQPEIPEVSRRVRVYTDGDLDRTIRNRRKGSTRSWGPGQVNTPPAVAPTGRGRIYFDKTTNRFRVSENAGVYTDLIGGSLYNCRLTRSADQIITSGIATSIQFTVEAFDTGNMHDSGSNTRITFPVSGLYLVGGMFHFQADTTGTYRYLYILMNGDTQKYMSVQYHPASLGTDAKETTILRNFVAGDYVELQAHHNASTNIAVKFQSNGEYTPIFWAIKIG